MPVRRSIMVDLIEVRGVRSSVAGVAQIDRSQDSRRENLTGVQ